MSLITVNLIIVILEPTVSLESGGKPGAQKAEHLSTDLPELVGGSAEAVWLHGDDFYLLGVNSANGILFLLGIAPPKI